MNFFDPMFASSPSLQRVRFHYSSHFHSIHLELQKASCAQALHICATTSLSWALKRELKSERVSPMPSLIKQLTLDALPEGSFANELTLSSALYDHLKGDQSEVGRALLSGRQALLKSIIKLEVDHLTPHDLNISPQEDPKGLVAKATQAWSHLRCVAPKRLSALCNSVWQASPESILAALRRLPLLDCPSNLTGLTIALHGFYFITPPQWALVRQLTLAGAECVFFIHDDGRSVVYDTWRRFFPARPTASSDSSAPSSMLTRPAQALQDALQGAPLTSSLSSDDLKIIRYQTGAELFKSKEVTSLLPSADEAQGAEEERSAREVGLYAADFQGTSRLLKMMSYDDARASADLGSTPAGQLLLALHNAVKIEEGAQGAAVSFELTHDLVRDIFASGYLSVEALGVYRRVQIFFEGCLGVDAWQKRAQELITLSSELPQIKKDTPPKSVNKDLWHPLEQLPWGNISTSEATCLSNALQETHDLLRALFHQDAQRDKVEIGRQLKVMRELLEGRLSRLSEEERSSIQAKLDALYDPQRSAQRPPLRVGLVSFIDAIRALLSVEGASEEEEPEEAEGFSLSMLRGLDRFLVSARRGPLHLITLSDLSFPNTKSRAGQAWPFHQEHLFSEEALKTTSSPEARLSKLLTIARHEGVVDAELYLLHLALSSKGLAAQADPQEITLSWVEDWGGEELGPSPFVRLLTREKMRGIALKAGGVDLSISERSQSAAPCDAHLKVKTPSDRSIMFPRLKYGSYYYCPRRFALQWLTGRGAYFVERYRMSMLIGNIKGYFMNRNLHEGTLYNELEANDLNKRLSPFLHEQERESSYQGARLKPHGYDNIPTPPWLLTIEGKRRNIPDPSPIDNAYKESAEKGDATITIPSQEATLMPAPQGARHEEKLCQKCPLQDLCVFGHEAL